MGVVMRYNETTGLWEAQEHILSYGLATTEETLAGAIDNKAVVPKGLASALALKANVTDVNDALVLKAPLASPAFTDIPTAPTAAQGTNTTQLATCAHVFQAMMEGDWA